MFQSKFQAVRAISSNRLSRSKNVENGLCKYSTGSSEALSMEYRKLGNAGIRVSCISFGSWITFNNQLDDELAYKCMKEAYDRGVNFFDNAEAYAQGEAEKMMGRVLKKAGWRRETLVVSTKLFWGGRTPNEVGLSRKRIIEGTQNSLKRMQLDYVDLLYCHRPDPHTPIEETVRAMNTVIERGLALYWGTSEWSPSAILEAHAIAEKLNLIPPTMEQPEYSMLTRDRVEKEYKDLCPNMGLTTWSPLKFGILSGKYNDGIPANSRAVVNNSLKILLNSLEGKMHLEKVDRMTPIAKSLGGTMSQLAIAWCLKNSNVSSVITGASRPEQVIENVGALDLVPKLTPSVMAHIDQILQNKPI